MTRDPDCIPPVPTEEGGELKPCPFCGCAMHLRYDSNTEYFGPEGDHQRGCLIGSIDFVDFADRDHAIREWNTRPTQPPQDVAGPANGEAPPFGSFANGTPAPVRVQEGGGPAPVHHHDRHPWAQPGDEPNRAWMLRFADPDMRTMVWTDADAEQDARSAYAQYSPAWNCYLFATVAARSQAQDVAGLVEAAGELRASVRLPPGRTRSKWAMVPATTIRKLNNALALIRTSPTSQEPGRAWEPTHRHVKRGTLYRLFGHALVQTEHPLADETYVYIYQDERGLLWVRTPAEFNDGRFVTLTGDERFAAFQSHQEGKAS